MLAYILNNNGEPLMPCKAQKARKLLDENKAKVISRTPFILKLLYGSAGYFALETLNGEKIHNSANVKKDTVRLQARSTTLIQQQTGEAIPPAFKKAGALA